MINYEDNDLTISREQLEPLAHLVKRMKDQHRDVELMERDLKEAKRRLRQLEEVDIPVMMDEVGLESVTMEDGTQLSVKETLYASIAAKNKKDAASWLINNGQGALVKEDVTVPFDRGQLEQVTALSMLLEDKGYTFSVNESINTASVKSVIKELLGQGVDVPLELFGAHFVRKAVLK